MDPYANMGCVLKISPNCDACRMKVAEIVGSISGLYNISIDAERGIADISGQVDPDMLLNALGKAGQHAELLRIKLQHPSLSYKNNSHYYHGNHGLGMTGMYGYGSHYRQPYPIHDPYWYSRNIHDPYHYPHHANYHRRYPYHRSTSSFGFAPIRNGCCHRVYL